jgi:hypothetical protein
MQWLVDKDGSKFRLEDETWMHIQEFHPEITHIELIESILLDPDMIVRSNWDAQSILYYKQIRPNRFRVVVVQTVESRIKTTLTTNKVKRGEVLWAKEKPTR